MPADSLPTVRIPNSVGLSISGGGFRATLFHLGAIRRLNELGVLNKLTTLSSVSGGSILNGFLASQLGGSIANGVADYDKQVSQPIRDFCSHDIRGWLGVESIFNIIPGVDNSAGLAKQYEQHLTHGALLRNMPDKPVHVLCSTDLAYGVNWMFKKKQCGDWQAGFQDTPADWKVSTAIACSSCFPPVFKPMNLNLDPAKLTGGHALPGPARDQCVRGITFSDGGVYDNLGVEPVWKDHEFVLVSDGGALFKVGGNTGIVGEVSRYISIPENQALAVRKRWLMASYRATDPRDGFKGAYWGIGDAASDYKINQGYSKDLAQNYIAAIRTDLDSFSEAEASVLENHGYWLADAAMRTYAGGLLPTPIPPLQIPHPDWIAPEEKIKEALKDSGQRTLLGRSARAV